MGLILYSEEIISCGSLKQLLDSTTNIYLIETINKIINEVSNSVLKINNKTSIVDTKKMLSEGIVKITKKYKEYMHYTE